MTDKKPYNPFAHDHSSHAHHDHDHGHDHDHDHEIEENLDPAQKSLADALQVSFFLLKLVMLGLVVAYLLTGVFYVQEQQAAVRLFFGHIVGEGTDKQVIKPGGPYFSWPYPIEQLITIPTSTQQLSLDRSFWFETQAGDTGKTIEELSANGARNLNPEKDGSLLTGDANVVHAKWNISYKIAKPVEYVKNIGDPKSAPVLVERAAERGIIHTIASLSADEVIKGQNYADTAKRHIQKALDENLSGIEILNVSVTQPTMPLIVREAYQAVINAENDRAQKLEQAQQERAKILGETAGEAWPGLLKLVEQVESAEKDKNPERIKEAEAKLTEALTSLKLSADFNNMQIGGKVAEALNDANTYRTQIVEQVRSESETFSRLLPLYKENPRIVRGRLWQDTKEAILGGDIETFYLPAGQPMLEINRDPALIKKRQENKLKADREAQAAGAEGN